MNYTPNYYIINSYYILLTYLVTNLLRNIYILVFFYINIKRGKKMEIQLTSKFGLHLRADNIKNFDEIENHRFSKVQIPETWNLRGI